MIRTSEPVKGFKGFLKNFIKRPKSKRNFIAGLVIGARYALNEQNVNNEQDSSCSKNLERIIQNGVIATGR